MAVPFPSVGTLFVGTFTPNTTANALNGINNALVAAGWTSVATHSQGTITISSLPTNGNSFTIGGVTYTFQTVLNNGVANNILIAANTTLQAQYIADALLAVSGGGTEWSTPTVANPNVTSTSSTNTVLLTSIGTGTAANSSFVWTGQYGTVHSQGRGFICTSLTTPQGLQANTYLYDNDTSGGTITVWWGSADGSLQSATLQLGGSPNPGGATGSFGSITITAGRTLNILANAFMYFTWLTGDKTSQGIEVGMIIPYLRDGQTAPAISAVTNNGGLIEVQTAAANTLITGNSVAIFGATGTVPVNGTGTVTVIDSTHFTLNGSTFSGSYISGGLVGGPGGAGAAGGISRAFCCWMDFQNSSGQSGHKATWRNQVAIGQGFYCINENSWGEVGSNLQLGELMYIQPRNGGAYFNWGGYANDNEAMIGWPGTSQVAGFRGVGLIWGALAVVDSVPMDTTNIGYLGHNWINMTDLDGVASLWLATT